MYSLPLRLLPGLLAAAQAVLWPGLPLWHGEPVPPTALASGLLATLLAATALGWRRRAPVSVLIAVVAVAAVAPAASSPVAVALTGTAGVALALHAVAVRSDTATAVIVTATLLCWQALWGVTFYRAGSGDVVDLLTTAAAHLGAVGLGGSRRRWLMGRQAAARRLAVSERSRQRAATAERLRLARELHDVSAHHLTSVVVTVDTARKLGDRRPELAAEAVAFAARTGRETLTALHRLVAVMRTVEQHDEPGRDAAGIAELVSGFTRLGQPVALDLPPALSGPEADAAYGIVREALTNALRYAPGAAVRVHVRPEAHGLRLRIDNDASPAAAPAPRVPLGAGRGITGMRERAAATGGTLTAAPRPGGGWRVEALLGAASGTDRHGGRRHSRRLTALQLAVAVGVLLNPVVPMLLVVDDQDPDPTGAAASALAGLLALTHALPLLLRRSRPWTALAAVLCTAALWPLFAVLDALPPGTSAYLPMPAAAATAAVYAVAAHSRSPHSTWWAVPAAAVTLTAFAAGTATGDRPGAPTTGLPAPGLLVLCLAVLLLLLAGARWAGERTRTRRDEVHTRESAALAASERRTVEAAEAERRQIAAELRERVLTRAALVVASADDGRLDDIAGEARGALGAMRELLGTLRDGGAPADRAPQPTSATLAELCAEHRATGRAVALHGLDTLPSGLPPDTELAVFRLVESALAAGDSAPAEVRLAAAGTELAVTVTGVAGATTGPVLERLRVQSAAAGGRLATGTAESVQIWLPARTGPAPSQEVLPSPSV